MPTVTYDQFVNLVAETYEKHVEWRIGQAAFNVLSTVRPALADQIRGTQYDPFHEDSRLAEFYSYVKGHWDE